MSTFAHTHQHATGRTEGVAADIHLEADRDRVNAGETIAVKVEAAGVESVQLKVVPAEAFDIDLRSLSRPGLVRLKGRADGTGTLIAEGTTAGGDRIERMLHLECVGPMLRLLGFGYIPG